MKMKDWIKKYEEKAEKFKMLSGFFIYFDPKKGFFCWKVTNDVFEIDHACTNNYKWLLNTLNDMAKERNCRLLRTATKHDPAAFMRLFKGKVNLELSEIYPNGIFYWVFERMVI